MLIPTSKDVANVAATYHQTHDMNDVNCNFKDGFPSDKDKGVTRIVYSGHFSHFCKVNNFDPCIMMIHFEKVQKMKFFRVLICSLRNIFAP
jgi:hypothetical protein